VLLHGCTAEGKEQRKAGREGAGKAAGKERKRGRKGSKRTLRDQVVPDFCQSPPPQLVSCIQPSLPQFHFTSPPLHFHPLPWPEFGGPRHSPRQRIRRLIDRPGAVGRSEAPVTLPETVFFFFFFFFQPF